MELTAENVENVFLSCLFGNGQDTKNAKIIDGITSQYGFNPLKLEKHKPDIETMLNQLPETFQEKKGGGWSFLNACQNSKGRQWTGLHQTMEQLFVLGMAIEKVKCLLPKEMWPALPGGMPYYSILETAVVDG